MRSQTDIDNCIKLVLKENYDSALSLCEDRSYLWKRDGHICEPLNYDPANRGQIRWRVGISGERTKPFTAQSVIYFLIVNVGWEEELGGSIMPKLRSIDIDLPEDFSLAEAILQSM